jgi:hypothetical protein
MIDLMILLPREITSGAKILNWIYATRSDLLECDVFEDDRFTIAMHVDQFRSLKQTEVNLFQTPSGDCAKVAGFVIDTYVEASKVIDACKLQWNIMKEDVK